MEYVSKNTIFGLKLMVKSGLENIFLKFLYAGDYFLLLHKSKAWVATFFWVARTHLARPDVGSHAQHAHVRAPPI